MHIKYPKKKDFFTWEELGCFAKALGNQKSLFYKNTPPEYHKEKLAGLDMKMLLDMIDMKALHDDLHRTYNMHDALYNCRVLEKAAFMLSNRYLSFQELREVRVAFQLYEHEDMMGLVIDEHILLRTLKVCGRTVSPIKLMQHIKHTKTHVQDRLLLYEFFDILLLCERDADIEIPAPQKATGVDNRNNLYKICDFDSILVPIDEKKIHKLNGAYEQGLLKPILGRKSKEQPSWRSEQPFLVDDKPRIELVSRHQPRSIELADHLEHSNKKVLHARCGKMGRGGRPFVDLNDSKRQGNRDSRFIPLSSLLYECPIHEKKEEMEISRVNFASASPRELSISPDRAKSADSQSYLRTYPGTTPTKLSRMSITDEREILVTPRDVHNASTKIENLSWDIETQTVRLERKTDRYMQEKYPSQYRTMRQRAGQTKVEQSSTNQGSPLTQQKRSQEKAAADDHFKVSRAQRRHVPSRENIYPTLKSRLQQRNTLLDYSEVSVPSSPFSAFLMKQFEKGKTGRDGLSVTERDGRLGVTERDVNVGRYGPRTLNVASLGNLVGKDEHQITVRHHESEVLELLDKFQEANLVASGKKGFAHGENTGDWKHTTFV